MRHSLYLHVGWSKCGSSALQHFFSSQPALFGEQGPVHYAAIDKSGELYEGEKLRMRARKTAEHYLSSVRTLPPSDGVCFERLQAHLAERLNNVSLILSQEAWSRQAAAFASTGLLASLATRVVVIAYVRPQVDLLNSSWWQWWCWRKQYSSPAQWLVKNGAGILDYFAHLQSWRETPGVAKVHIRILPRDVVGDALALLRASTETPTDKLDSYNATLPRAVVNSLKRLLKADLIDQRHMSAISFALKRELGKLGCPPWGVSRSTAESLISELRASNEQLLGLLDAESSARMRADQRWWDADAYRKNFRQMQEENDAELTLSGEWQACLDRALLQLIRRDRTLKSRLSNHARHVSRKPSASG